MLLSFGRSPKGLDDLVPGFLPAIPIDPYCGNTLIYVQGDDGAAASDFVVYRVRFDGQDDGGNFGSAATFYDGSYDLDLDCLDRPANPRVPNSRMGVIGSAVNSEL